MGTQVLIQVKITTQSCSTVYLSPCCPIILRPHIITHIQWSVKQAKTDALYPQTIDKECNFTFTATDDDEVEDTTTKTSHSRKSIEPDPEPALEPPPPKRGRGRQKAQNTAAAKSKNLPGM